MKTLVRRALRKAKHWLSDSTGEPSVVPDPGPFDNSQEWVYAAFTKAMSNPSCSPRPQYVWGVLNGASLAKVLQLDRVSVLEFGVAAGAGLLAMEAAAEECERLIGIQIDVCGFDTGTGFPKLTDYRDMPHRWFEGYYPCDQEALQKRLHRAKMLYGMVDEAITSFVRRDPPPIAFVAIDLCLYSSTREALRLLEEEDSRFLPRTPFSFRSSVGPDNCPYTGELLAISEFNANHDHRKICRLEGMSYFVPAKYNGHWTQMLYSVHRFQHPLYGKPQAYHQSAVIEIGGREVFMRGKLSGEKEGREVAKEKTRSQ